MVLGLQHLLERVGEGKGEPILDSAAGEEMMHVQPAVAVALGRQPPESPGTLYISTQYSQSVLSLYHFFMLFPLIGVWFRTEVENFAAFI